jgi:hypothetical protein
MMIEVQKNLNAIKRTNKRKKLLQLTPLPKVPKRWFYRDGVESIHNVYIEHHPIKMGIQNGPNTMDHDLATFFHHNLKLMW